jgi:O-antigen ligase
LFFSLSVLSCILSIAAAQAFLALAAVLYAAQLLRHPGRPGFPPIKLPLALFFVTTAISLAFAATPAVGWFVVRKFVLFLIMLLAVNLVISRRLLGRLFAGWFVEAAIAGVVATVQFVRQYRGLRALSPADLYHALTSERISGFQGHWMNFGGQQMLVFAALAAFLLLAVREGSVAARQEQQDRRGASRLPFALGWVLLGAIVLSIVLNFSRGIWLGCVVATIYLIARWKARVLAIVPLIAVIGYFAAPSLIRERVRMAFHPQREPALSIRLEMWQVGLRMIRRHPLTGVGPNNISEAYPLYLPPGQAPEPGYHEHLHNDYIQLAAERGLPCLAAWLWMMIALVAGAVRVRRRVLAAGSGEQRASLWAVEGAIAAWLAFMVEGCFEFNFGSSPVLMMFLFVASTPFVVERFGEAGVPARAPGDQVAP